MEQMLREHSSITLFFIRNSNFGKAQMFLRNLILRCKMFLPKVRDLSLIVLMFLVFIQLKHSCSYMTIDIITLTYLHFDSRIMIILGI